MNKKKGLGSVFMNGILHENPTFRLVLGTCPTIAVTTSAINGLGMGLAATFVLLGSNVVISLLKKFVPDKVRIPCYVVVIASFVTIVEMLMKAYMIDLYNSLGLFIPLIVVNCIILARAEAFANKNSVVASAVDGVGMGLGFTMSITIIGVFREIIGFGTVFGLSLFGSAFEPMMVFALAPGGFIAFGLFVGAANAISQKIQQKKKARLNGQGAEGRSV